MQDGQIIVLFCVELSVLNGRDSMAGVVAELSGLSVEEMTEVITEYNKNKQYDADYNLLSDLAREHINEKI